MGSGRSHHKGLIVQGIGDHARLVKGFGDNHRIHLAALEHVGQPGGVVFFQVERHIRRQLAQGRNQRRQQIRPDGENHPQAERPDQLVFQLAGQGFDHRDFFQHPLRLLDDALACVGDGDFIAAALEQGDAQFFFQLAHGNAQRGLTDKAGRRRPAKVALARHGHDVAQFGESHPRESGKTIFTSRTSS